ncbi:HAMP domain-containing protein [Dorea formicigenerans]|uniref:HAMP domain-containing protein n=1 Tax=Dorea formicigenerans TaxID=39486 RepID=UPI00207A6F4B|nr:HAMP domain-containing protein [Dorea formicigenerans]MBT9739801.1 HAMP domain-containing protein [Dorea formicigenerans]
MEKIRNLSLKKTMVLYTILSLIVTFFLSVSIIEIAGQIQEEVWWKYVDQDEYYQAMNDRNENFEVVVPRPNQSKMSRMDWHISETCDFLRTYGVLLFSFAGCGIAVSLFYKNKLKRPIQELKMASQMIAEEDLDFHMAYENEDEMGMLCREFERMRGQLEENNRRLWQMIEDERVLRAAIAHDIRSPLVALFLVIFTVLFSSADIGSGYIKNIGGQVRSRRNLIFSKASVLFVYTTVTMLLYFIIQIIAQQMYFGYLEWGNGSELLRYFGIQILLHYALVLISMAIAVVLNSNVFSMTIVICLCMNTMIVLYGVINHLIQKAGVENFQILKYTVTGKIALLSMSPTNKECLTAVVIAAAFGIVVTLLTAWVFRKRDI